MLNAGRIDSGVALDVRSLVLNWVSGHCRYSFYDKRRVRRRNLTGTTPKTVKIRQRVDFSGHLWPSAVYCG